MSKPGRTRRKRRQAKMTIRSKGKFKVNHKSKSGRTGQVAKKQRAAALHEAEKKAATP